MQFAYTADQAGAYVAPVPTVFAQSEVVEGGELFLALLAHLRRFYHEVYGPAVFPLWEPQRREVHIREGEVLRVRNSINSIKVGPYTGRFNNLSLAGMKKPSPNLTTVYIDTPIVGPSPEPLECVPFQATLGSLEGIP